MRNGLGRANPPPGVPPSNPIAVLDEADHRRHPLDDTPRERNPARGPRIGLEPVPHPPAQVPPPVEVHPVQRDEIGLTGNDYEA